MNNSHDNDTPKPAESGPLDLAEIEQRLLKATPGPWKWAHDFDIRGRTKHWCLYNPERPDGGIGDGIQRCIDYYLVTFTDQDHYCEDELENLTEEEKAQGKTWAARSLDTRPDFQLIANAPTDIARLIAEVKRLREGRERLRKGLTNLADKFDQQKKDQFWRGEYSGVVAAEDSWEAAASYLTDFIHAEFGEE